MDRVVLLGWAIREAGEIPSGHLYAQVMGHFTYNGYMSALAILKYSRMITEVNHLLKWVGPTKPVEAAK